MSNDNQRAKRTYNVMSAANFAEPTTRALDNNKIPKFTSKPWLIGLPANISYHKENSPDAAPRFRIHTTKFGATNEDGTQLFLKIVAGHRGDIKKGSMFMNKSVCNKIYQTAKESFCSNIKMELFKEA